MGFSDTMTKWQNAGSRSDWKPITKKIFILLNILILVWFVCFIMKNCFLTWAFSTLAFCNLIRKRFGKTFAKTMKLNFYKFKINKNFLQLVPKAETHSADRTNLIDFSGKASATPKVSNLSAPRGKIVQFMRVCRWFMWCQLFNEARPKKANSPQI